MQRRLPIRISNVNIVLRKQRTDNNILVCRVKTVVSCVLAQEETVRGDTGFVAPHLRKCV